METKVVSFVDQARQWAEDIAGMARGFVAGNSEGREPTAVELWSKASPRLEKALSFYDKKDSESLPDTAWLLDSKARCQKELDEIIDAVILVLEACGAVESRKEIRNLQDAITESRKRIGQYREQLLSAPPQVSLSPPTSLWTKSREGLEAAIADEDRRIEEMQRQIGRIKEEFRNQLRRISLEVAPDEADSLLCRSKTTSFRWRPLSRTSAG